MKSWTITLAVTLALSSSSTVSGLPHFLESVSVVPQSSDHMPQNLLKRGNEKIRLPYEPSNNDNQGESDGEDEDDECDDSSDSHEAVQDLTEHYYKIGSNATGVGSTRASSSSSQSNHYGSPSGPLSGYSSPPEEKKWSNVKPEVPKESYTPVADPLKAAKPSPPKESSSSQSHSSFNQYSSSSSYVHSGESYNPPYSASVHHGKATFYSQDGNPGSCGVVHQDTDYIVAIQSEIYDDGKFCGKTIVVTRKSTGQSINCIAADMCPGCPTPHSLDLSEGAFKALGEPEEGLFDIVWKVSDEN